MDLQIYLKGIYLFRYISIFFLLSMGCASGTGEWRSKLLYSNKEFGKRQYSTRNSILLLPLITEKGFDTGTALPQVVQKEALHRLQGNIEIYFKKDFEEAYLLTNSRELLDSFYIKLFANDFLALTSYDSVWRSVPSQYIMVIRINNGARINSFDGILKRKAVLEIELWDVKNVEVVWRAESSGFEMNSKITDAEFIAQGIKEAFKLLPEFLPVANEENW